jgi:hypothetical protein
MKKLNFEQMAKVEGGIGTAASVGLLCAATVFLSFSLVFAPFAGATGAGCAVGLYALNYWDNQGIDVNEI